MIKLGRASTLTKGVNYNTVDTDGKPFDFVVNDFCRSSNEQPGPKIQ